MWVRVPPPAPAVGICLATLVLMGATVALAQTREFTGRVTSIDAGHLVVESRQGESSRFVRTERTRVEGRADWGAIQSGDRVLVRWTLGDGPRKARSVIVLGSD